MQYSTYVDGDLRADVIKLDNHWGCRLYEKGELKKVLEKKKLILLSRVIFYY